MDVKKWFKDNKIEERILQRMESADPLQFLNGHLFFDAYLKLDPEFSFMLATHSSALEYSTMRKIVNKTIWGSEWVKRTASERRRAKKNMKAVRQVNEV